MPIIINGWGSDAGCAYEATGAQFQKNNPLASNTTDSPSDAVVLGYDDNDGNWCFHGTKL